MNGVTSTAFIGVFLPCLGSQFLISHRLALRPQPGGLAFGESLCGCTDGLQFSPMPVRRLSDSR